MSQHIKKRIMELESLRALAAILIVYAHMPNWHNFFETTIKSKAYLMVDLFFVLSGFVMYTNYKEKINHFNDLLKFQFLRFGRLYPVHISIIFIYISLYTTKYLCHRYLDLNIVSPAFNLGFKTELISNVFLLQGFFYSNSLNPPSWSISVEFYTYLIFALIILKNRFVLLKFLIFCLVSCFLLYTGNTYGMENLLRCFAGFFMGCISVILASKIKGREYKYLSAIMAVIFLIFLNLGRKPEENILIFFISCALILSIILYPKGKINCLLKLPALLFLGKISYSIYMVHFIFIWLSQIVIEKFFRGHFVDSVEKYYSLSLPQAFTIFTLIYILIILSATLLYKYIEEPARKRFRFFVKKL